SLHSAVIIVHVVCCALSTLPRPPRSSLFPYTTLFRSIESFYVTLAIENQSARTALAPTQHPTNYATDQAESPSTSTARQTVPVRSEEHTSELQSRENLVCRLLLEKKNYIHTAARRMNT